MDALPPVTAYIGIGANLGDARANVHDAIARLARLPGASLLDASASYRTAPIDSSGDDYINAVARITTTLPAEELLLALAPAIAVPGLGPAQAFLASVADQAISRL